MVSLPSASLQNHKNYRMISKWDVRNELNRTGKRIKSSITNLPEVSKHTVVQSSHFKQNFLIYHVLLGFFFFFNRLGTQTILHDQILQIKNR